MNFTGRKVSGGWIIVINGHDGQEEIVSVVDNEMIEIIKTFVDKENEHVRMLGYLEEPKSSLLDLINEPKG